MHRSAQCVQKKCLMTSETKNAKHLSRNFFVTQKNTGLICASCVVIVMLVLHKWLVVGGITFTPFLSWIPDYIGTSRPLKSKQQRQPPHVHIFFRTEIIQAEALNCSIDRFSCQKEQYKHANRYPALYNFQIDFLRF